MKALNMKPPMRVFDQHLQRHRGREVTPVLGMIAISPRQRPFPDQPADAPVALCSDATPAPRETGRQATHDCLPAPTRSLPRAPKEKNIGTYSLANTSLAVCWLSTLQGSMLFQHLAHLYDDGCPTVIRYVPDGAGKLFSKNLGTRARIASTPPRRRTGWWSAG